MSCAGWARPSCSPPSGSSPGAIPSAPGRTSASQFVPAQPGSSLALPIAAPTMLPCGAAIGLSAAEDAQGTSCVGAVKTRDVDHGQGVTGLLVTDEVRRRHWLTQQCWRRASVARWLAAPGIWLRELYRVAQPDWGRLCLNVPLDRDLGGWEPVSADVVHCARSVGLQAAADHAPTPAEAPQH
jgi:hypothetical protein